MDEKINSQSKKERENFIRANLRIITWETVSQKALRTVPPVRDQNTVIYKFLRQRVGYMSNDILLTVYSIQIYKYKASYGSWVIAIP